MINVNGIEIISIRHQSPESISGSSRSTVTLCLAWQTQLTVQYCRLQPCSDDILPISNGHTYVNHLSSAAKYGSALGAVPKRGEMVKLIYRMVG